VPDGFFLNNLLDNLTAMDTLEAFNQALFLIINGTATTPAWLVSAARIIADDVIYLIPLLLAGMWLWGNDAQRKLAIRACLVAMLGIGVNQLIGLMWQHPRPFMIGLGHTFLPHAPDSSFPSDHATVFSGIALTLLLGGARRLGVLTLLAGVAVAWARVFLGVHFPLDMFGAAAVACVAYVLIAPLWHLAGMTLTRSAIVLYRKLLARPIAVGWLRR
jgi:undecaprenyl-diphosphatase